MSQRDALLQERAKTHGSFETNAERSQFLKAIFAQWGYRDFSAIHQEALDMIALKLSRIFSGQPDFHDHWDDIAGYARLVSEFVRKPKPGSIIPVDTTKADEIQTYLNSAVDLRNGGIWS